MTNSFVKKLIKQINKDKDNNYPKVLVMTMVKDECDIIDDWVIYYGNLFGYENLYIIDNYSSDGTWELLNKYKVNKRINLLRKKNYRDKGNYMKEIANSYGNNYDFVYPVDIDEFVVFYNKQENRIIVDKNIILGYLVNLIPKSKVLKTNYIYNTIINPNGYNNAVSECEYGDYKDYGNFAKTFFSKNSFDKMTIDHGNHVPYQAWASTDLCLIHYHVRNLEQIKKKIINNVVGLGYKNDLTELKNIIYSNPNCAGNHHVNALIQILEGKYRFPVINSINFQKEKHVSLKPMIDLINELKKI